MLKMLTQLE